MSDEIAELRGTLRLADDAVAARDQTIKDLKEILERIEQERLTWAMACECYCPACTALDKLIRGTEPQTPEQT